MPSIHRCYRILGLRSGADTEEIKQAYRDLAHVWHPDRFAHSTRLQEKAQRNLKRINEAYDTLMSASAEDRAARPSLLQSMSAVLDLGDLRSTRVDLPPRVDLRPPLHRGPPPVLGLDTDRRRGSRRGRRRRRSNTVRLVRLAVVAAIAGAVFLVVFLLR